MKKTIAIILTIALTLALFAGCGAKESTGTGYGIANGGPSMATVTADKKGAVLSASLEEAFKLTDITAKDGVSESDIVSVEVSQWGQTVTKKYYKTIKVDAVEFTFDADKKDYVTGGKTFGDWIKDSANIKAYFEAIEGGKIVTGNGDKAVYTKQTMYKSLNGYWTVEGASKWVKYKDATVEYVVKNGFDKIGTMTQGEDKVWKDSNNVTTGATWSGMPEYLKVLETAYIATKTK